MKKVINCLFLICCLFASFDLIGGPLENEILMIHRQFSRWKHSFDRDIPTPKTIQEASTTLNTLLEHATHLLSQCSDLSDEEQITQLISTINEQIASLSNPVYFSKNKVLLEKAKDIYEHPHIRCRNHIRVLEFQKEELEKILSELYQMLEDNPQEEEQSQILEAISIVNEFIQDLNASLIESEIEGKIDASGIRQLARGLPSLEQINEVYNNLNDIVPQLELAIKNEKRTRKHIELEKLLRSLHIDINFTKALSKHVQNPTQKSAKKLEDLYEIAYSDYVRNALIQTGFRQSPTDGNR